MLRSLLPYHPCPNNYTPVHGADTILCKDSGCTTELCCDYGKPEFAHFSFFLFRHDY